MPWAQLTANDGWLALGWTLHGSKTADADAASDSDNAVSEGDVLLFQFATPVSYTLPAAESKNLPADMHSRQVISAGRTSCRLAF